MIRYKTLRYDSTTPPPLLVQPISPKINDSYYKYDTLAVLC